MSGFKCYISLIIVIASLFSVPANSQQISDHDSLVVYNSQKVNLQPHLHYSLGSTFMIVPHLGSVAGFTMSPVLSIPLSPKLSVEGGIIAGRYSAFENFNHESPITREFTELSLFGSASYHVNYQLTLYGAGIKQLTGSSPFLLPKSSYVIGSSYKFESFTIGVSVQMSKWDNNLSPFSQGFYSPLESRTDILTPFGR